MAGKLGEKYKVLSVPNKFLEHLIGEVLDVRCVEEGANICLYTPDRYESWYFNLNQVELVSGKPALEEIPKCNYPNMIDIKDFLSLMHPNTGAQVTLTATDRSYVHYNDVEIKCDTKQRLGEVMSALLILFGKDL